MLRVRSRKKKAQGNGLEVPCVSRFVARRRLIKKLEVLLQPRDRLPDSCPF